MLCDVNFNVSNDVKSIINMIARINGNEEITIRLEQGVYEIGHFSFEHMLAEKVETYPELEPFGTEEWFNCYGVCDNYKQILEQCPILVTSERKFVISLTKIEKKSQPDQGGWRWHKWGPYIGTHKPKCEYLYNEKGIEFVYCYHIYELV